MKADVLRALETRRWSIRADWESLLRLEPISSPLAHPDTLVHLLDTTINEIFVDLALWSPRRHSSREPEPSCPCARNPLLAYFAAGRQAMCAALIDVQVSSPALIATSRDEAMACLDQVFRHLARREIEAFCSICQFRTFSAGQQANQIQASR